MSRPLLPADSRPAIIGGSGLYSLQGNRLDDLVVATPCSRQPVSLERYSIAGREVIFLCRHGNGHSLPPHAINYKANIHALKLAGVTHILAVNAAGGIHPDLGPRTLCIPDQLIDYTWGRDHTFNDELDALSGHIDFTAPYSETLREMLTRACRTLDIDHRSSGVYGCTQGPRLETAAEITRMKKDGCDVVGQTGMPEASLAREIGIEYASLCLVVNRAAGLGAGPLTMEEIGIHLAKGMDAVFSVLEAALDAFQNSLPSSLPDNGNS